MENLNFSLFLDVAHGDMTTPLHQEFRRRSLCIACWLPY
jgi:hypothetical protein